MQTTTAPYYSHPGPPSLSQPPIGTGASTGVSSSSSSAINTAGGGGDPVSLRVSVAHLLSRAYTLPCSAAAQAFTQLVQPIARFQLALDVLLPLFLDSTLPVSSLLSPFQSNSFLKKRAFHYFVRICFLFVTLMPYEYAYMCLYAGC